MKSPGMPPPVGLSFHDRLDSAVVPTSLRIGFGFSETLAGPIPVVPMPSRYLFSVNFSAVLPLPNRSYVAPIFGVMSFHARLSILSKLTFRFGARTVGAIDCGG